MDSKSRMGQQVVSALSVMTTLKETPILCRDDTWDVMSILARRQAAPGSVVKASKTVLRNVYACQATTDSSGAMSLWKGTIVDPSKYVRINGLGIPARRSALRSIILTKILSIVYALILRKYNVFKTT